MREQAAARHVESILLNRAEAAKYLGMSVRQFDRYKMDMLAVPGGKRKRLYDPEDLRQWAVERKHRGSSTADRALKRSKSISVMPANDTVNPRAAQILQQLKQRPRASTPRLFPVGEPKGNNSKEPGE